MTNRICPFIGLQDDRDTALDFPAEPNTCFKANPPDRVKLDYQKNTCLSTNHQTCPIFLANQPVPLPADIAAPPVARRPSIPARYVVIGLLALVLLTSGVLAALAATRSEQPLIPQTGGDGFAETLDRSPAPVEGLANQTVQPDRTATRLACPLPPGWTTYIVLPTDTFTRLSGVFQISSDALREANCLSDDLLIRPGDVIYVPVLATATLPPTPTRTLQVYVPDTVVNPQPTADSSLPEEAPAPQNPPPPTDVTPPTKTPSPTDPPAPTSTTQPPPTDTIAPPPPTTSPPTDTPSSITISDSNWSGTVNCNGADVTVDGNNNEITLTGTCSSLTVTGNHNDISLENPTSVNNQGNGNTIN